MPPPTPWSLQGLLDVITHHWGFSSLRPLQEQAMRAVLERKDSLVVLPTGGGKSLCYQAPAVYRGGTTVVLSPLISLMKDQVDALQRYGISATQIDSSQSGRERFAYEMDIRQGNVRLVFVSPERLVNTDFYRLLQAAGVDTFAIDEAHCISHWGHDFRPEYRQLGRLRDFFPNASIHAYTATATDQVRQDIIKQLSLVDPVVLVGNFDRPNLTYRVLPRLDVLKQTLEVLDRHKGEAGIIYCLRRADVDDLANDLKNKGHKVRPYHAGLSPEERSACSEAFAAEEIDIVVATVAFGMGIDRSNVRFVLHTAMPKSLEHYQQETGRAGRDGLEAECVLLYSGSDFLTLKAIIEKSVREAENPPDPSEPFAPSAPSPGRQVDAAFLPAATKQLEEISRYCRGAVCRHKALVQYFGQAYEASLCNACDLCLGDTTDVADATTMAQKLLSCVARVRESFGINHVIGVLRGEDTEGIRKRGHEKLTTYGLLKGIPKADLREWIYQLIGQGVLVQTSDEYPKLRLNEASWEVMRGKRPVRLVQMVRRKKGEKAQKSQAAEVNWEGVDQELFEELRVLRYRLATEEQVPPYRIFGDHVLRELARRRPSTPERMRHISGVGDFKLRQLGDKFLDVVRSYCTRKRLPQDVSPTPADRPLFPADGAAPRQPEPPVKLSVRHETAFALFRDGAVVEDVMHQMNLSRTTIVDYLRVFISQEKPASISKWVQADVYQRVAAAARQVGTEKLKPIFLALGEKISYDDIRLVVAHLQTLDGALG
jgi:ATP-dependent DNA helicase RecQ